MDELNIINTVVSIIVGIFGIGGYIYGITIYLRNKNNSTQRKQTAQLQAAQSKKAASSQAFSEELDKLDWMQVLWLGLEDALTSRSGVGWLNAVGVCITGSIIVGIGSAIIFPGIWLVILIAFYVIFAGFLILFYIYFVGRRIEKKLQEKNNPNPTPAPVPDPVEDDVFWQS